MLDIVAWVIFGALVGWIASMIVGTNEQQGAIGNIVVGIIGAFIGGFIMRSVGEEVSGINLASLIVAVIGAVILLLVIRILGHGGNSTEH